jgi:hypothetical protein
LQANLLYQDDKESAREVLIKNSEQFPYHVSTQVELIREYLSNGSAVNAREIEKTCHERFAGHTKLFRYLNYLFRLYHLIVKIGFFIPAIQEELDIGSITLPAHLALSENEYLTGDTVAFLLLNKSIAHNHISIVRPEVPLSIAALNQYFTINTLFCNHQGDIYDPLGYGVKDVRERRLRFVGHANVRLQEDPLNILRAIKYISLGFKPDAELKDALMNWPGYSGVAEDQFRADVAEFFEEVSHKRLIVIILKEYNLDKKIEEYLDYLLASFEVNLSPVLQANKIKEIRGNPRKMIDYPKKRETIDALDLEVSSPYLPGYNNYAQVQAAEVAEDQRVANERPLRKRKV